MVVLFAQSRADTDPPGELCVGNAASQDLEGRGGGWGGGALSEIGRIDELLR